MTHEERVAANPDGLYIEGYTIDFNKIPDKDDFLFVDYKRAERARRTEFEIERQFLSYVSGMPFAKIKDLKRRDYLALAAGMYEAFLPHNTHLTQVGEDSWDVYLCECVCECSYCGLHTECVKCECGGERICTLNEILQADVEQSFINRPGQSVFSFPLLLERVTTNTDSNNWTMQTYSTIKQLVQESMQSPLSQTQVDFLST